MKQQKKKNGEQEYQDRKALAGFFSLLLKIDQRINPDLYENKISKK